MSRADSSPGRSEDRGATSRTAVEQAFPITSPQGEAMPDGFAATPGLAGLVLGPAVLRESSAGADPLGGSAIPDDVFSALRRRRGGGRPLPSGVASQIGEQLGPAAGGARIHTDGEADRLARSVQSVAFSYGSDVYFTQGSFAPDSQAGQRLLAHELSHVEQSVTAPAGGGPVIGRADDVAEREADQSADRVLGALRRQAGRIDARRESGAEAGDEHACSGSRGHRPLTARRQVGELVRRVYSAEDQPTILQLPQVDNNQERLTALGAHNWSRADTVQLAQQDPAPSYDQMNTLMGRLTAGQTTSIRAMCADWAEVVTVAGLAWPPADLARHAATLAHPTAAELQTVAAFFSVAQADGLLPVTGWADLVTLAGSNWTAADIAEVAALGAPAPTSAQLLRAVSRFTAAHVRDIIADGATWTAAAALADAAAPAVQSPALTLSAALTACDAMINRDVQELVTMGFDVAPDRYKALLIGTDSLADTHYEHVMDYLRDARWFSICFDTAQRLFEDLGDVAGDESGGARDAKYPLVQQQTRSALLVAHLTAAGAAGQAVIFNIHVGGHGFSLTVIGANVYQLEAFASQADDADVEALAAFEDLDASLLTSIGANHTYPLATVTGAVTDMTATNPAHRARGATAMGWNAGPCGFLTGGAITDPMAIWWESASLLSNAQIVANVAARIQRQRRYIAEKFGI